MEKSRLRDQNGTPGRVGEEGEAVVEVVDVEVDEEVVVDDEVEELAAPLPGNKIPGVLSSPNTGTRKAAHNRRANSIGEGGHFDLALVQVQVEATGLDEEAAEAVIGEGPSTLSHQSHSISFDTILLPPPPVSQLSSHVQILPVPVSLPQTLSSPFPSHVGYLPFVV
jgi:hypothetical protein